MILTLDKSGERADAALARLCPDLTRSAAQKLLEQGAVLCGGRPLKKNDKLRQGDILDSAAVMLRPGGRLVYSTCTLNTIENEGVVEAFLQENSDYTLEKLPLPAVFPENTTGMLALVPGEYDTDGFFIAKLRRKA